ncbi:MAG: DnaD domain protein [Ruminococcaceae bacterium]|nr:DnaD domain protein [Oscillospiraceae bacterium]
MIYVRFYGRKETKRKMSEVFEIRFDFVEKWGRFAKPEYLQIYLYILSQYKKTGKMPKPAAVAKKLEKELDTIEAALEFWATAGEMVETDGGFVFAEDAPKPKLKAKTESIEKDTASKFRTRPSYASAEIDAAASVNKEVDYLFREAERILEKILSPSDFEMLYSFVDWLGLPVEVVIMLLRFAAGRGKTGKRYLETVAIDWADKGIDTYESAEEYIREIEVKLSNEGKVRGILGIYDRALTQTEKKYIKLWTFEKNVPTELVAEAYDRTVAATGKLSWAYMNKILMSWVEEGISTVDGVREKEALFKLKSAPTKEKSGGKKSKFDNYTDTNKPDYSDFAEKILEDMLEG